MKHITIQVLAIGLLLSIHAVPAFAYGRGGGFRGGSAGGYRGGYSGGGVRGPEVGGYRGAEVGGYRGAEVGGYRGPEVGGYRGAEVGGSRGVINGGHYNMATDFGFGHVAGAERGRAYVAAGHSTRAYSSSLLASRGAAVRGGFYHYGAYNSTWWKAHPAVWRPAGWNAAYAWRWATWPALTGWFGWSAAPVYYDYGNTIVYSDDQVYIDGQPGPTAAQYYQQAADQAQSAPPEKNEDAWQPLGVFAMVQGEQTDPSAVFQLAVNKAGTIRGNYFNVLTDTTLAVRGAVDKKTQRASWTVGDQKTTVYDTGIANLTREESPLLVHFGKDRTQQWLLVRVQEQDAKTPPTATEAAPSPPVESTGIARMTVIVPADAEVYFDGTLMTQTGTQRTYKSPPLQAGASYTYSIRARWTVDGKPVEQTRTVPVTAGAKVRVDFTNPLP